jgi:hypothetical protein
VCQIRQPQAELQGAEVNKWHKEQAIQLEMASCVHFRGIQHDLCGAGVNIRELVGGPDLGWGIRIPCLLKDSGKCEVVCEKRELPTHKQAEATVTENDARFDRTMKAVEAAHKHAKDAGLGTGHGGKGSMLCPLGCGGVLHYTVAAVNGHMHAACEKGCMSWME